MNSQDDEHGHNEPAIQGATADINSFAVDLPVGESGNGSATTTTVASSQNPLSVFTVQTQNGQVFIQQPAINVTNNGPTNVHNNGSTLPKGHIILRQKPEGGTILSSQSLLGRTEKTVVEKVGVKRPLITSAGNVITKVIITKNPLSGQAQPYPAGSSSQTLTLTSLPSSTNATLGSMATVLKQVDASSLQPSPSPKTVKITSQGILSPVKTVIATIPGTGSARFSVPIHKIPISPAKTPTKITMIPAVKSPVKQTISDNITVLSRALNSLAQSGNVAINPGSPSKVIIKQGPPPTGTAITLKAQSLPTLAPQSVKTHTTVHPVRAPQIAPGIRPISISSSGTVQPIQVSGNKFHYVRLVSPASQSTSISGAKTVTVAHTPQTVKSVTVSQAPEVSSFPQPKQMKITLPVQSAGATLAPKPVAVPVSSMNVVTGQSSVQRILLPATATSSSTNTQTSSISSLAPIQPAPSNPVAQIPMGTTILTAGNNSNLQGFALVPASYVTQLQQQLTKPVQTQVSNPQPSSRQTRDYVPIASINPAVTQYTVSRNTPSQNGPTLEATGARPRKPCNCTKSQCLKLYCDCFANGEFCQNCNCTNCANNLEHEEERSKAIKSCLERNPHAFHPKIGKGKDVEGNRRHNKGCNCKRSGCLKNYCECYEAKIMCSNFCKCIGCKNFEESPDRKTLMHLADAAEVRVQQQTAAKTKLSSQISCVPSRPPATAAGGERLPFAFITADVAEATSACLLAQAEEAERMRMPPVVQERMIIEEFGRCLMQIIESANRTRTANSIA